MPHQRKLVSSPFRGTQIVYTLGERTDCPPAVRPFSVGSILSTYVHVLAYISPILPSGALDMQAESRSLSFNESSLLDLFGQMWRSNWAESEDCAPFDVTFQAAERREAKLEGRLNPGTFYRSYAACMTKKTKGSLMHVPQAQHLMSPLYLSSRSMGSFDYTSLQPPPAFLFRSDSGNIPAVERNAFDQDGPSGRRCPSVGEEHWANDGVVPLFSQWHPLACGETRCKHTTLSLDNPGFSDTASTVPGKFKVTNACLEEPESGIWHVHHIDSANHLSIVPFWFGTERQQTFWKDLGYWLRAIEIQRSRQENFYETRVLVPPL
ncbi:uncharacterized protein FIBRA_00117 [Fibroporia radiculosa]|uniref:Uncharacterized protein n=1 Tax=Fibroporia radiculosa TaxID=599839 RepID=J7SCG9_9APHY|nr:uncharacterized protein FIBRA_00117 [Fibroporia radiculosa]CCL98123.1 predicted protein [Fibroporia radiculosa]